MKNQNHLRGQGPIMLIIFELLEGKMIVWQELKVKIIVTVI